MWYLALIYFVGINIVGFVIMGIDKSKARRQAWRIPEKTLMTIAALFGSYGMHLGMKHFRHKTKHKLFTIGVPFFEILQTVILVFLCFYANGIIK